jgi:hypothetical protein
VGQAAIVGIPSAHSTVLAHKRKESEWGPLITMGKIDTVPSSNEIEANSVFVLKKNRGNIKSQSMGEITNLPINIIRFIIRSISII